jgi:hypothetical protein
MISLINECWPKVADFLGLVFKLRLSLMYDISEELTDMFPSLVVAEFRERLSVIKRET